MQFINVKSTTSYHPVRSITEIKLTKQLSTYEFTIDDPRLMYVQVYVEPKDLIYIEELRDNQVISVLPLSSKYSIKFTPAKRTLRFKGEGKIRIFAFRFICP